MKEEYFTIENIDFKSKQILEEAVKFSRNQAIDLIPKNSALLILDIQKYFSSKDSHAFIPSLFAILPKINRLKKLYEKNHLPVIVTRHINTPDDAKMMNKWWNDLITENNPLSNLADEIDNSNAIIIPKKQYDAFYDTNLETLLCEKKVSQLIICGVMTHLCCETTARSAFMKGFEVFFAIDGTATYNEKFHRASILNLTHGFAVPILINDIIKILGNNFG